MIVEIVFEICRFTMMAGIILFVCWVGWSRHLMRNWAWRFSILAFVLLFFGATIDVMDDYEAFQQWIGWHETLLTVILEKGVGYLGGFLFILLAAFFWVPHVDALRLKKLKAEKESSAKSRLVANMSHELRTPLNAILGFSEIIAGQSFGLIANPKYVEYGADIYRSAQHLLTVINDLLDLSRIEAGTVTLNMDRFRVENLLEPCLLMVEGPAAAKNIGLSVKWEGPPPELYADVTRMRQVLINVLSNAVKFTNPGGCILVTVAPRGGAGLDIRVRDTGIGMNEDDIEVAFTPFGQIVSGDLVAVPGTGLGLPIARLLMEAHGGELRVDSNPGVGTQVELVFPPHCIADGHRQVA